MVAEIKSLTLGFEFSFVVKHLIEEIIGKKIKIEVLVDSTTVFNVIAWDGKQKNDVCRLISRPYARDTI